MNNSPRIKISNIFYAEISAQVQEAADTAVLPQKWTVQSRFLYQLNI